MSGYDPDYLPSVLTRATDRLDAHIAGAQAAVGKGLATLTAATDAIAKWTATRDLLHVIDVGHHARPDTMGAENPHGLPYHCSRDGSQWPCPEFTTAVALAEAVLR